MSDLNLAGLFRHSYEAAIGAGKRNVLILISNAEKDRYIHTMTDTLFVQEHSPIKRATLPCQFTFYEVTYTLETAEIEEGTNVIQFS